jgi:hypothetical protein
MRIAIFTILLIAGCLCRMDVGAQTIQTPPKSGAPRTLLMNAGGAGADSLQLTPIRDTVTAWLPNKRAPLGAIQTRPQDSALYYANGNAWLRVATMRDLANVQAPEPRYQTFTGSATNSITLDALADPSKRSEVRLNTVWLVPGVDYTMTASVVNLSFTTEASDLIHIYYRSAP